MIAGGDIGLDPIGLVQRFGEQRQWISGAMAVVACVLFLGGAEQPEPELEPLGLGFPLQNVAVDLHHEGPIAEVAVGGEELGPRREDRRDLDEPHPADLLLVPVADAVGLTVAAEGGPIQPLDLTGIEAEQIPGGDPDLERKALAYALWGPLAIRNRAYFNHSKEQRFGALTPGADPDSQEDDTHELR